MVSDLAMQKHRIIILSHLYPSIIYFQTCPSDSVSALRSLHVYESR